MRTRSRWTGWLLWIRPGVTVRVTPTAAPSAAAHAAASAPCPTTHGVCVPPAARYTLDNLNKEYNALNKAVAKLKIVRHLAALGPGVYTH